MKMSIGFDVSKKTIDVAFFNGNKLEHFQVANSEDGFLMILKKCKKYAIQETTITMEATGTYHQCAADFFYTQGFIVSVVNPLIIKRYGEMKMLRAKTDKADAQLISEYGYNESPYPFRGQSENSLKIKGFLKVISDLQLTKTQYKNRLEALTHQSRQFIEVQNVYLELIKAINDKIKQTEKEIQDLSMKENGEEYLNLMSIPGVGKHTTSAIIGYFGDMTDFATSKQVVSFIGINPSPKRSGTSVRGRGTISRKGNNYLRRLLYLASLSASMHNKSCVELYQRLISKGKNKKLALIAVANKLTRQIFAIVKYNRVYEQNFGCTR